MKFLNIFKKPSSFITLEETEPLFSLDLKPMEIMNAKTMKDQGQMAQILGLFERLKRDNDNLASVIDIRKEAAKTAIYALPELTDKQTEYFEDILDKLLPDMIEMAIELKLSGVLFRQINYKLENSLYIPESFTDYKNLDLRIKDNKLSLFIEDTQKTLPELNFITLFRKHSILESLLKYYTFFSFAVNNWASFTEIFGKPIRVGKYQPGINKTEKTNLMNMLKSAGTNLSAMISEGTAIEFIESQTKTASSDLYKSLATFCEDRETRRILGQTLTTKAEKNGSYALGKVQDLVRKDILIADLRDASLFISDFFTMLNKINFSEETIKVKLTAPKTVDLSSEIEVDEKVNNIIEIDPEYFYEKYNIPEPKDGMKLKQKQEFQPGFNNSFFNLAPGINPTSEIGAYYAQFLNLESTKKTAKEATKLKSKIKKLKGFKEVQDLSFPTDLYYVFGSELSKEILKAYVKERKKVKVKNDASKDVSFDFTLDDIEALNAFRAESFVVAGVHCDTLLSNIKKDAEKAISEGITFHEWRESIQLQGFEANNPYYLRTNFQTAINNAHLAGKWKNTQETKEIFPYLQYFAVTDERVRDRHLALHGTIKPVDDPFWNKYYPPNDWNCRCDAEQLTKEEAENDPNFSKPTPKININQDFQKNTGKDLNIWGKWLDRQIINNYTFKDLDLPTWKEIAKKATVKAPDLLKLESTEKYKEYFEKNVVGNVVDAAGFPVDINNEFFEKLISQRNGKQRLERLNWIKQTIKKPDEIWNQKDPEGNTYSVYLKAFKNANNGGFSVVEMDKGQIRTFFEPDRESNLDKNRSGKMMFK